MTPKERVYATINRQAVDYPASWLGLPVPAALPALYEYFEVDSIKDLKLKLKDDVWPIEVPYNNAPFYDVGCALQFAIPEEGGTQDERTLTAPGFFCGKTDPKEIDLFDWPKPSDYLDIEKAKQIVNDAPDEYFKMGIMWSAHFQDTCAAFGMEDALITMMMYPDMFQAVIDKITDFYLELNEIFYKATKGKLDGVLIGNDFGSQTALMVDPDMLRTYVLPGTKKLVEQAKSYGLKVVHHSCGSIHPIINDLYDLGVDIVHPIQALATDMSAENLSKTIKNGVFCGGIDAQELLVNGNPADIKKRVSEIKDIFPTGLIVSPSHEAILPDIAPENIEALFKAVKH